MKKTDTSALKEKGEEENVLDATPVSEPEASGEVLEPKVEEEAKVEAEAETIAESEAKGEEAETGEIPKKGYTQRVRELVTKAKEAEVKAEEAEAKAQSLADRLAELTVVTPPAGFQPFQPQAEPVVAPGEEIDTLELDRRLRERETRILQQADALSQLRTKQQDAINRINNEANEAVKAYPQLDPTSDSFDEELSNSVTEAAEGYIQKNPYTANVKQYVDKLMRPYQRAVTKEVGKVSENLAKQVSETALRPTSVQPSEKTAEDMTPEELEKKLGVVQA